MLECANKSNGMCKPSRENHWNAAIVAESGGGSGKVTMITACTSADIGAFADDNTLIRLADGWALAAARVGTTRPSRISTPKTIERLLLS